MFFIKKMCILCLCEEETSLIKVEDLEEPKMMDNFLSCCPEIHLNMNIPKLICLTCQNDLKYLYKFKEKCVKSNAFLRAYVEKMNSFSVENKYQDLHVHLNKCDEVNFNFHLPDNILNTINNFDNDESMNEMIDDYIYLKYANLANYVIKDESLDIEDDSMSYFEPVKDEIVDNELELCDKEELTIKTDLPINAMITEQIDEEKPEIPQNLQNNPKPETYTCSNCNKVFNRGYNYKFHIKTFHLPHKNNVQSPIVDKNKTLKQKCLNFYKKDLGNHLQNHEEANVNYYNPILPRKRLRNKN